MPSDYESIETIFGLNFHHNPPRIAVVIPCFRVKHHVLKVIDKIGQEVSNIYCVDDKCDQRSGEFIQTQAKDPRVHVIFRTENGGVGAATMTGYVRALEDKSDVIVKLDGDGQMDPTLIPKLVRSVVRGEADYAKGNRLYNLESMRKMPAIRLFGNAVLSFMIKLSTGYWHIADPTNGFTAIDARLAKVMPLDLISKRYFFESDLLFRLYTFRAMVVDVPMDAIYGDEVSNLNITGEVITFIKGHITNCIKRILFSYFLRDFSMTSVNFVAGLILLNFGFIYGLKRLLDSHSSTITTPAGVVMLAALPIIIGMQLLLAFLSHDMANEPKSPISARI
jgi:dolichol-phosphate mannosyltransferase